MKAQEIIEPKYKLGQCFYVIINDCGLRNAECFMISRIDLSCKGTLKYHLEHYWHASACCNERVNYDEFNFDEKEFEQNFGNLIFETWEEANAYLESNKTIFEIEDNIKDKKNHLSQKFKTILDQTDILKQEEKISNWLKQLSKELKII